MELSLRLYHVWELRLRCQQLMAEAPKLLEILTFENYWIPDVPKGYTNIRMKFRVKTDSENLKLLKRLSEFSPVYNTITHGAKVDIDIEPK